MKRLAALIAVATVGSITSSAAAASPVPTAKLMYGNSAYPEAVGYGQVKPAQLSFGKTPMLCHIHWYSWGGQIAVGTGVGSAVNPTTYKRVPAAVVVYLYKLKLVHGKPAYTAMNFEPVPTQPRPRKLC